MKLLRGFGKNYFTFSAMLMTNVVHKLESQTSIVTSLINYKILDSDVDDPPDELEELLIVNSSKACHCNYYFKLRTELILLINNYIPRCPFYCTYFAFRRTGVHPPIIL